MSTGEKKIERKREAGIPSLPPASSVSRVDLCASLRARRDDAFVFTWPREAWYTMYDGKGSSVCVYACVCVCVRVCARARRCGMYTRRFDMMHRGFTRDDKRSPCLPLPPGFPLATPSSPPPHRPVNSFSSSCREQRLCRNACVNCARFYRRREPPRFQHAGTAGEVYLTVGNWKLGRFLSPEMQHAAR